jgi:hypothetical protein
MTFRIDYAREDFSGLARFCFSTFRIENRYLMIPKECRYLAGFVEHVL